MVAMLKRAWAAPLWCHALALCIVLLALLPLARPDAIFFPDEGSGLAQAQQLADGDGWSRDPSFPAADPKFETFPILNSPTAQRIVPLGAHPTYALVVEPWYAAFGAAGAALLSIVGLVVTAVLGARIAERLRPGLARAALWAIALASPLFVSGYLVVAHTVCAACIAGMVLALLRVLDGERILLMVTATIVAALAAGLLRNEALLLVGALGVVTVVVALLLRRWPAVVAGGGLAIGAVVARRAESAIRTHVVPASGGGQGFTVVTESGGWVGQHVDGAVITLFLPSTGDFGAGDILLVLAVLCAVGAAVVARRRPEDRSGLLLFGGLALGFAFVRLFFTASPVPSILWTCPLLTVALALGNRVLVSSPQRRILSITTVLFLGAVLVTQYGNGGGIQWGFRYFAIALPFVIPLALIALVDGAARLSEQDRRVVLPMLVGLCALVTLLGFLSLRATRAQNDDIVAGIRATYLATPADDGGKPVVVTTKPGTLDRYNWDHLDETRWLILDDDHREQLGLYLDRIRDLGVGQVTFLTADIDRDRPLLAGHGTVVGEHPLPDRHTAVVIDFGTTTTG